MSQETTHRRDSMNTVERIAELLGLTPSPDTEYALRQIEAHLARLKEQQPRTFGRRLLLQAGDILPVDGLRAGITVRVTGVTACVDTDLPAAGGGYVSIPVEAAMRCAGLPLWPRAEDVMDNPGILRGSRLDPVRRAWV